MSKRKYKPSYVEQTRTKLFRLLTDERLLTEYRNYEKLIAKIAEITTFKFKKSIKHNDNEYTYELTGDGWFTVEYQKEPRNYHLYIMLRATDICGMGIEKHLETFIKLHQAQKKEDLKYVSNENQQRVRN